MDEKPSRFGFVTRIAVRLSLFMLLFFTLFFFLWVNSSIPLTFYIDNYRETVQIGGYVLAAGYVLTMVILIFFKFEGPLSRIFTVGLFIFTTLLCCLSTNISLHLPTVLDRVKLKDETYYLTGELESFDILAYHQLYKCENTHINCERTPFWEGGGASFRPVHLILDGIHGKNEISVVQTFGDGDSTLIYTYGTPNRDYDGEPVQLGNHLYYLAYHRDPEFKRTYMLFQCNLDHTGCIRLPFEYQGSGRYTEIIVDESTNELSVIFHSDFDTAAKKYVDETLIFTYGEHPTCHVEGCKIPDELR